MIEYIYLELNQKVSAFGWWNIYLIGENETRPIMDIQKEMEQGREHVNFVHEGCPHEY